MSLESLPLNYERTLLGCLAKYYQDQRKISVDHGYRYIQHCRSNSLDRLTIFLIYKGCRHADASTHLSFPGLLISRLVDLHATRACHPLSTLSRTIKYLYVKNKDSYIIIAATGLPAKGIHYNWIRLGRQRESGMLRALGP